MKVSVIIFAALVIVGATSTVSANPETAKLEKVSKAVVDALNSSDVEFREKFLKEYYLNADSASAIERWLGHLELFSGDLGRIEIHDIDVSNPALLRILVHTANPMMNSQWKNLEVFMDAEQTDKLFSLAIRPGSKPIRDLPDRALTTAEIAKYVGKFIDEMVARDAFSGAGLHDLASGSICCPETPVRCCLRMLSVDVNRDSSGLEEDEYDSKMGKVDCSGY